MIDARMECALLDVFFFQAEDGIRDLTVTGVQTCALPISADAHRRGAGGRVSAGHEDRRRVVSRTPGTRNRCPRRRVDAGLGASPSGSLGGPEPSVNAPTRTPIASPRRSR